MITLFFTNGKFVYDYCSMRHSYEVLEELKYEVFPVLELYDIRTDIEKCPLFNEQLVLTYFQNKLNVTAGLEKYEDKKQCRICSKRFETEDFLEFHWIVKHTPNQYGNQGYESAAEKKVETIPKDLIYRGENLCLADYCDIFECLDHPEMELRNTAYNQRNYKGYRRNYTDPDSSGKPMKRTSKNYKFKSQGYDEFDDIDEFSMRRFSEEERAFSLQKCVNLLTNCLVGNSIQENIITAYDILYHNYCEKFELTPQNERKYAKAYRDFDIKEGFYHVTDMEREQLQKILESGMHPHLQNKYNKEEEEQSVLHIFKILFGVLCFIGTLMYYVAVYLTKYDHGDY
ncbi:unnamed protein product [Moneuplotes crassus]|uniref:C2H2-type domain-containing protein n=1 Tax=Euplotes crassus TaxID=5936 RepID=A0AAD1UMM8_EUPCR|nr:unnamed protein product [Moneuplotes crassus]